MPKAKTPITAAERNQKVLAVLTASKDPMSPSEIATAINEPWCMDGHYPSTAAISPVCKRIGAVKADRTEFRFGLWFAPGRDPRTGKVTKK